jgi:hypothetical protein
MNRGPRGIVSRKKPEGRKTHETGAPSDPDQSHAIDTSNYFNFTIYCRLVIGTSYVSEAVLRIRKIFDQIQIRISKTSGYGSGS